MTFYLSQSLYATLQYLHKSAPELRTMSETWPTDVAVDTILIQNFLVLLFVDLVRLCLLEVQESLDYRAQATERKVDPAPFVAGPIV